jgi:type IV fimbrial biogenesis protein FimT
MASAPASALAFGSGFTVIELLVMLAIAAVLAGVAAPGLGAMVDRQRLRRACEDMSDAIYFARREALRRGGNVTLHKGASEGCSAREATDWSCGWFVFDDADGNGELGPGEAVLQTWPPAKGVEVKMNVVGSSPFLPLSRWGRFGNNLGFSVRLRPAGSSANAAALMLCMSSGGRLRTLQGTDQC